MTDLIDNPLEHLRQQQLGYPSSDETSPELIENPLEHLRRTQTEYGVYTPKTLELDLNDPPKDSLDVFEGEKPKLYTNDDGSALLREDILGNPEK